MRMQLHTVTMAFQAQGLGHYNFLGTQVSKEHEQLGKWGSAQAFCRGGTCFQNLSHTHWICNDIFMPIKVYGYEDLKQWCSNGHKDGISDFNLFYPRSFWSWVGGRSITCWYWYRKLLEKIKFRCSFNKEAEILDKHTCYSNCQFCGSPFVGLGTTGECYRVQYEDPSKKS